MKLSVVSILMIISLCISIIGNAGEIKEIQISPKIKIIREEEGKGANLGSQDKKVRFLEEKGSLKKEIEIQNSSSGRISLSPESTKIAIPQRARVSYKDGEEFRKRMQEAHKTKNQEVIRKTYEELNRVYEDIDVYDDEGNLLKTISTNFAVWQVYINEKGSIVVFGVIYKDREGTRFTRMLRFYDPAGKLLRSIDSEEATRNGIALSGRGMIYKENSIVWVGAFTNEGTISRFDFEGNIMWQYRDKHLSTSWLDIGISENNNIIIKATYIDEKNPITKKTWLLDSNGILLELIDGWNIK